MEKRGIRTERGNINRGIEVTNQRMRQLKARISKLQNWLKEEAVNDKPPTLSDVIQGILSRKEQTGKQSYYSAVNNLKTASKTFNFLSENGIEDMAGLEEKVKGMYGEQSNISEKLKSVEKRLKTLDEHLLHSKNYKAYRGHKVQYEKLYAQYRAIKRRVALGRRARHRKRLILQTHTMDEHHAEITLYEAAERYLKDVMQDHFDPKKLPPISKWEAESKLPPISK